MIFGFRIESGFSRCSWGKPDIVWSKMFGSRKMILYCWRYRLSITVEWGA